MKGLFIAIKYILYICYFATVIIGIAMFDFFIYYIMTDTSGTFAYYFVIFDLVAFSIIMFKLSIIDVYRRKCDK